MSSSQNEAKSDDEIECGLNKMKEMLANVCGQMDHGLYLSIDGAIMHLQNQTQFVKTLHANLKASASTAVQASDGNEHQGLVATEAAEDGTGTSLATRAHVEDSPETMTETTVAMVGDAPRNEDAQAMAMVSDAPRNEDTQAMAAMPQQNAEQMAREYRRQIAREVQRMLDEYRNRRPTSTYSAESEGIGTFDVIEEIENSEEDHEDGDLDSEFDVTDTSFDTVATRASSIDDINSYFIKGSDVETSSDDDDEPTFLQDDLLEAGARETGAGPSSSFNNEENALERNQEDERNPSMH